MALIWSIVYVFLIEIKCDDLVKWSIITHIELFHFVIRENPITKFIMISSHFYFEIGSGWSNPVGFWHTTLICWHCKRLPIYSRILLFIPTHQYIFFRSCYVIIIPGWIAYHFDLCPLSITCHLMSTISSKHILFWNLSTPSTILNSESGFIVKLSWIFLSLGSSIYLRLISFKISGFAIIIAHKPSFYYATVL